MSIFAVSMQGLFLLSISQDGRVSTSPRGKIMLTQSSFILKTMFKKYSRSLWVWKTHMEGRYDAHGYIRNLCQNLPLDDTLCRDLQVELHPDKALHRGVSTQRVWNQPAASKRHDNHGRGVDRRHLFRHDDLRLSVLAHPGRLGFEPGI